MAINRPAGHEKTKPIQSQIKPNARLHRGFNVSFDPWPGATRTLNLLNNVMCDNCVLANVEVEHADIGEIRSVFKREFKALLRLYGTGGFTGSYSSDGILWTRIGTALINPTFPVTTVILDF